MATCYIICFLLSIFYILSIADVWTTIRALKREDVEEKNPIIKQLMEAIGVVPALLFVKIVGVIAISVMVLFYCRSEIVVLALLVIDVGYGIIVARNYKLGGKEDDNGT